MSALAEACTYSLLHVLITEGTRGLAGAFVHYLTCVCVSHLLVLNYSRFTNDGARKWRALALSYLSASSISADHCPDATTVLSHPR
jgi:hypothetical protein